MDPKLVLLRTIVGFIGNGISTCFFLRPMLGIVRFYKNKSTEELEPFSYAYGTIYYLMVLYLDFKYEKFPNVSLTWTIEALGLVFFTFYTCVFVFYTKNETRKVSFVGLLAIFFACLSSALPALCFIDGIQERTGMLFAGSAVCMGLSIGDRYLPHGLKDRKKED